MKLFGKTPEQAGLVHFIGIGGIGMSGLAEVLARQGFKVQGSDLSEPYTLEKMLEAGVTVHTGHDAALMRDATCVVVSTAVKESNVELAEARKRGLPVYHRAEVLAEIMRGYQTIAVSGTHGKTSTTALIYATLKAGGLPVGIINGGVLNDVHSNVVLPPKAGDWLVVEADESDASFLKLSPTIAVITNIEPEHMDTYGTEEKLVAAFVEFADKASACVLCSDDMNVQIVAGRVDSEVMTYGLEDDADVYAREIAPRGGQMVFDAVVRGGVLPEVVVNLPGAHYIQNSLAALTLAQFLKLDLGKAVQGLATFAGVGRRFSKVGHFDGALVIDDYGHHPTEIATTLDAARGMHTGGQVIAVIQPHRYTRLRDLMDEFAGCATAADVCVILPVYAAGEEPITGVSHEILAQKMTMPKAYAVEDEAALVAKLEELAPADGDVIVCLGAGSISGMAKRLGKY